MHHLFLFVPSFLICFSVAAQTGKVSGTISDRVSNEQIPFANVVIQGTTTGTSADVDGKYVLEGLEPGEYNLEASAVGFKNEVVFEVQVTNARTAVVNFKLEEESKQLEAVEVTATNNFFKPDESPVSLRTIGTTEIKRTPGGNRDISKVIRSLPGVAAPPSFRNDIIIRGGSPSENTFYLDGIQIPVINHFQTQGSSGGPVGIINVDILREVNFYSGAFPSNRGNALSSVFDFQLKDPRQDKWTFNGVVGATDLGITLEGPVSEKSSLVFSARRSYLKFLFGVLNLPFLPVYNDFQFKYKWNLSDRSRLTLIGIGAIDDFELNFDAPDRAENEAEREEALYTLRILPVSTQWNYTTGLKYERFRKNGATTAVISTNKLNNEAVKYRDNDESDASNLLQRYQSQETEYRLRVEDYFTSGVFRTNIGLSLEKGMYNTSEYGKIVTQQGPVIRDYDSRLSVNKWGLFLQTSASLASERLVLSAGIRADANDYSSEMKNLLDQLSPRFSAAYKLTQSLSWNFNSGIYYQLPPYTVLGFREGGELVNRSNNVTYIRNSHVVTGLEVNLKRNARITLEGFYKKYSQYPFLLEDSISLANLGADFGTIGNAPVNSTSEGRSYGAELLFQQKLFDGYYGLLSYTWVRSEFTDRNGKYVPSSWDYNHLISLTGGKRMKNNWEVGFRFLFSGGPPFTPYNVSETIRRDNWDIRPYALPDYERLNTDRIGAFHQLDVRIDKKYFFRKWSLDIYVDIQNAYGFKSKFQDNIDVQRDASGTPVVDQANPQFYLPKFVQNTYGTVLPSIGLIVEL